VAASVEEAESDQVVGVAEAVSDAGETEPPATATDDESPFA